MIYLNLIPRNMWYLNLRKMLPPSIWDSLSKEIRNLQNYTCYCCGINSTKIPKNKFHTHEAWLFNDKSHTVALGALVCVCELCHTAIHYGFAGVKNKSQSSFKRIMEINHWSYEITNLYIEGEFEIWSKRSSIDWTIDLDSFKKWLSDDLINEIRNYLIEKKIHYIE